MLEFHKRNMKFAEAQTIMSDDPSTKVGCVIMDGVNGTVMSWGHNHIALGIPYTPDMLENREWKYPRVIHAEQHALAKIGFHTCKHPIMYVTHQPCERCAAQIIEAGVKEVYTHMPSGEILARWPGMLVAQEMFREARITLTFLDL